MRRPLPIATIVIGLLLVLGAPFLNLRIGEVDERTMPASSEARQVAETLQAEFESGEQHAVQVVIPSGGRDEQITAYATQLSALPRVARVDAPSGSYVSGELAAPPRLAHTRFTNGGSAYLSVVPVLGEPEAVQDLVRDVRATPAPFDALVGGRAASTWTATPLLSTGCHSAPARSAPRWSCCSFC